MKKNQVVFKNRYTTFYRRLPNHHGVRRYRLGPILRELGIVSRYHVGSLLRDQRIVSRQWPTAILN